MGSFIISILLFISCGGMNTSAPGHIRIPSAQKNNNNNLDIEKPDSILSTGWYFIINKDNGIKRLLDKASEYYFIDPTPITTAKNFTQLRVYAAKDRGFGLLILLDEIGTKAWSSATKKASRNYQRLGFILDNKLLYLAPVFSQITNGTTAVTRNDYTKDELESFKTRIEKEIKN